MKKIRKREREKSRKKKEEESESEKESEGKKMKEDPDDGRHRGKRTKKVRRVEPEPVPEGYFIPRALSTEMKDDLERRGTMCVFIQTSRRVSSRDVLRFFEPELKVSVYWVMNLLCVVQFVVCCSLIFFFIFLFFNFR